MSNPQTLNPSFKNVFAVFVPFCMH